MVVAVVELLLVLLLLGLLYVAASAAWTALRSPPVTAPGPARLPPRDRAWLADQIEHARWTPAHDEADRVTRVLARRSYIGLDGHPHVLEERVLDTFPADDPAWEARFTEAMSSARFRCAYLNGEQSAG